MSKIYDPNVIPDWTGQFPPGRAHVRIESIDDVERTSTGKYQIRVTLRGLEPVDVADQPHFERFVIGTNEDPEADDPNSWKGIAARRYKDMLKKAGIEASGSVEKDTVAAVGQALGILVSNEEQRANNRDGSPNPYAGRIQASIRSFFIYGEQPVGDGGYRGVPPAAAPAVPTPAAKPAPAARTRAVAAQPQPAAPVQTVACSICGQPVPRVQFAAHVAAHEAANE